MIHRFGDFQLDEAGRSLSLKGEAIELQPKVFDLLAHLVRNAGRVVPKDELLDTVWPGVTVTEASLQRAVSLLRTALRKGGMEEALKSYVRLGYRFAIDQPDLAAFIPKTAPATQATFAEDARKAAEGREWGRVLALLSPNEPKLAADDFELWAFAIECMGRPLDAAPHLRTAIERYAAEGRTLKAAHCAVTLAKIHLEQGETAAARGWIARATALIKGLAKDQASKETEAYHLWMQARFAAFEGQPEEALARASEAHAMAEASGSVRLQALTLVYLGFFHISLGNTKEGLEKQDHAAAMALSSQVDPITGSLIYCNILWSCRSSADWSRASQWTAGFEAWCEANFAKISPSCQLHRAEVMGVKNTLADALARVHGAIAALPNTDPWAVGDAYRVRGDIRAAIGDIAAAKEDYAKAYEVGWDAEPGNAALLYEAGDTDGALAALDRVLARTDWFSLQRRGWITANKARICALAGRIEEARACLKSLKDNQDAWPSAAIRALAMEAEANLPPAKDAPSPVQLLNLARQLWTSLGGEYHAARIRLDLAERMIAAGDVAGALVESRCAQTGAEKIGARVLQKASAELTARLER
jgi:DNA-binding winged helix-turn-helix (wHTH) protein